MSLPTFTAQNPDISGYSLGWSSCTAFAAEMAASFDRQVPQLTTGGAIRQKTGDTLGGLTLAQIDLALRTYWSVDLDTVYRDSWANFAAQINAGRGAILQGGYGPIADSRFDAGGGFRGNHAIFIAPGWIGMDPLADGRRSGIYKYHGEAYTQSVLKAFAGKLNTGSQLLGAGLVYAAFTRPHIAQAYRLRIPAGPYGVYTVSNGVVTGSRVAITGGFSAMCSAPRLYPWPNHTSQRLVRLTSGSHAGQFVRGTYARPA
jgi:hypothetical protein